MESISVSGNTLPQAYHNALVKLYKCGDIVDCPDYNTKQLEVGMRMIVREPLNEPMISKLGIHDPASLQQYCMEMLYGIMDFEIEKGNWAYTYHSRMENQVHFVIDELTRNPASRRAVISVRDNEHDMGNENPACLQHLQYFIRDGKLDCFVLFRSNDACKATFMNAFALIMLQQKIAAALNVEVGIYVHSANSFHCYEKDIPTLEKYNSILDNYYLNESDLTYCYVGEWDELMKDEIPDILEKVEKLKGRA